MSGKPDLHVLKLAPLTLPSFAKINLCLEILGRREDGFHEVRTLLQTIDLRDELTFKPTAEGVKLRVSGRAVSSGDENTVLRAVDLFSRRYELAVGLEISLFKRIPIGAGLGGGSSNAAITLMALGQLMGRCLTFAELSEMAAELGSDVPFFLSGGLAFGWGRGERTEPWIRSGPEAELLLVYPEFEVSTKDAYAQLRAATLGNSELLTRRHADTTIRRFREVLDSSDWSRFQNDLEQPCFDRHPELRKVVAILQDAGCDFAALSGSGSAIFGIGSTLSLEKAERDCVNQEVGDVIRTRFVSGRDYWSSFEESGLTLPDS